MSKIAFIPIDNRPVCYDLPQMVALLDKNNEIFLPDITLLGDLTKNAQTNEIIKWIETLDKVDYLILSLDTIAHGGLIPSRRSTDTKEAIIKNIDRLFETIKLKNIKVFAFSSIMRISNNNVNEEEKEYWSEYGTKIFQYSFLTHKGDIEEANKIEIPNEILKDYLNTRKRNFEINKYYIDLKKQGFIDTLVFSKDDCAEFGLNVKEAQELELLTKNEDNIFIKTGADEIPLSLLSRALNKDKQIKIAPVYTNSESINKISKYEDISVEKSVNSQIELCGGIVCSEKDCDLVLLVNNFKNEQGELVMNVDEPLFNGELKVPSKPYFVVDILNANGADNNFVQQLLNKDLKAFYGYSAWNTTGNSLGGGISCALTYFGSQAQNKEIFARLQTIRFLDDWAYQANVRKEIRDKKENLENDLISEKIKPFELKIKDKFGVKNTSISYSFPWNRFFEVRVSIF